MLIPFLLEGVAGVRSLNQADGIHPNAEGHALIAETVWKTLRPLLVAPKGLAPEHQTRHPAEEAVDRPRRGA